MRQAIVLFTKPAVPGSVKTRLTRPDGSGLSPLSAEQAADLHRAFLLDVAEVIEAYVLGVGGGEGADQRSATSLAEFHVAWALAEGQSPESALEQVNGFEQVGEDLGTRLLAGLKRPTAEWQAGRDGLVLAVGSDHPELTPRVFADAFEALQQPAVDVTVGPADDGGFYLLALRSTDLNPALFQGIEWSTSRVREQLLENAESLGWRVAELELGHDCDTPSDLDRLIERLAASASSFGSNAPGCAHTRACLRELGLLRSA